MPSSHQNQARSPAFHSIRSSAFHRISHRSHAFHPISHQPGWLTSCNTGLKVISAHRNSPASRASPAHIIRPKVIHIPSTVYDQPWLYITTKRIKSYYFNTIFFEYCRLIYRTSPAEKSYIMTITRRAKKKRM